MNLVLFLRPAFFLLFNSHYLFYTAKTQYWKFKTNIPCKGIARSQSLFQHSVSVSDLSIPTFCLPILLQEICGPILGIYKSLIGKWMWKLWDWGRAIPRKGIHKWDFRCSVYVLFSLQGGMALNKVKNKINESLIK